MYIYATILNGCLQYDLYISLLRSPNSGCFVTMRRTWCCQCPEATPGTYHGLPWTCPEVEGVFSCLYHCIRVLVFKNMSTSTELQLCFLAWKLGAVNPGSKQVFVWQCSKTYMQKVSTGIKVFSFDSEDIEWKANVEASTMQQSSCRFNTLGGAGVSVRALPTSGAQTATKVVAPIGTWRSFTRFLRSLAQRL